MQGKLHHWSDVGPGESEDGSTQAIGSLSHDLRSQLDAAQENIARQRYDTAWNILVRVGKDFSDSDEQLLGDEGIQHQLAEISDLTLDVEEMMKEKGLWRAAT